MDCGVSPGQILLNTCHEESHSTESLIQALRSQAKRGEEQSYTFPFPISSSGSEAGAWGLLFTQIFLLLDRVVTIQVSSCIFSLMLLWSQPLDPFSNQGKTAQQSGCLLESINRHKCRETEAEGSCMSHPAELDKTAAVARREIQGILMAAECHEPIYIPGLGIHPFP